MYYSFFIISKIHFCGLKAFPEITYQNYGQKVWLYKLVNYETFDNFEPSFNSMPSLSTNHQSVILQLKIYQHKMTWQVSSMEESRLPEYLSAWSACQISVDAENF